MSILSKLLKKIGNPKIDPVLKLAPGFSTFEIDEDRKQLEAALSRACKNDSISQKKSIWQAYKEKYPYIDEGFMEYIMEEIENKQESNIKEKPAYLPFHRIHVPGASDKVSVIKYKYGDTFKPKSKGYLFGNQPSFELKDVNPDLQTILSKSDLNKFKLGLNKRPRVIDLEGIEIPTPNDLERSELNTSTTGATGGNYRSPNNLRFFQNYENEDQGLDIYRANSTPVSILDYLLSRKKNNVTLKNPSILARYTPGISIPATLKQNRYSPTRSSSLTEMLQRGLNETVASHQADIANTQSQLGSLDRQKQLETASISAARDLENQQRIRNADLENRVAQQKAAEKQREAAALNELIKDLALGGDEQTIAKRQSDFETYVNQYIASGGGSEEDQQLLADYKEAANKLESLERAGQTDTQDYRDTVELVKKYKRQYGEYIARVKQQHREQYMNYVYGGLGKFMRFGKHRIKTPSAKKGGDVDLKNKKLELQEEKTRARLMREKRRAELRYQRYLLALRKLDDREKARLEDRSFKAMMKINIK